LQVSSTVDKPSLKGAWSRYVTHFKFWWPSSWIRTGRI